MDKSSGRMQLHTCDQSTHCVNCVLAGGHDLLQMALLIWVHAGTRVQVDLAQGQGLHPNLLHSQQHNAPKCPDHGVLLFASTGHWTWQPGHSECQSPEDGRRFLDLTTGIIHFELCVSLKKCIQLTFIEGQVFYNK